MTFKQCFSFQPYHVVWSLKTEIENKRICWIFGLKSGHGHFKYHIWEVMAYEIVFETVFDWETKWLLTKWSLTGSGCLQEVVTMRELTVQA